MNKMFDLLSAVASASAEALPAALDAARAFVRACEDEGRVLSREEAEELTWVAPWVAHVFAGGRRVEARVFTTPEAAARHMRRLAADLGVRAEIGDSNVKLSPAHSTLPEAARVSAALYFGRRSNAAEAFRVAYAALG